MRGCAAEPGTEDLAQCPLCDDGFSRGRRRLARSSSGFDASQLAEPQDSGQPLRPPSLVYYLTTTGPACLVRRSAQSAAARFRARKLAAGRSCQWRGGRRPRPAKVPEMSRPGAVRLGPNAHDRRDRRTWPVAPGLRWRLPVFCACSGRTWGQWPRPLSCAFGAGVRGAAAPRCQCLLLSAGDGVPVGPKRNLKPLQVPRGASTSMRRDHQPR